MKELQTYFRSIEKRLPSGCHKKRFIRELQISLDNWLAENPGADLEAVQQHFGTPEAIANSFVTELDATEIVKKHKLRKWIISIVAGAIALALVIWIVFVISAYIDSHDSSTGQIETSPITEEILEE